MRVALLTVGVAAGFMLARTSPDSSVAPARAIDHVGISTSDIDRSLRFYRDLLGMELVAPVSSIDDDPRYNRIFGLERVRAKGAMLRLGGMQLELWEFERPRGRAPDRAQPVSDRRINHICFEVGDVQAEYERLRAAGVRFHHPPQDFGGPKAAYGRDPDGNVFELIELRRDRR